MIDKKQIIDKFSTLSCEESNGMEVLFSNKGKDKVFERVSEIKKNPITKVQLNQLFTLSGLPAMSFGFFKYYFLMTPPYHTYDVKKIDEFDEFKDSFIDNERKDKDISSIDQLLWGIKRIYFDSLLYFGNITNGYKNLSKKDENELINFFKEKRFPIETIKVRGKTLDFEYIDKEDRYLISEMACKTYDNISDDNVNNLKNYLIKNYNEAQSRGIKNPKVKDLLEGKYTKDIDKQKQYAFKFSAVDMLEKTIESPEDIDKYYEEIAKKFYSAQEKAIQNTEYYLSLVRDLDVYVATSMREKKDFIEMANTCEKIFKADSLKKYYLRYFDPTISAANGHEDKGLIECLMVKASKVLIYTSGFKESYGKDAEAAMALSSGKPVIFYVTDSSKAEFYKNIHPLTKLIDFSTGIANGAIVTFDISEVVKILKRIFDNDMQYKIDQPKPCYFRLKEKLTDSVVRLQTNNKLLALSFWNYFERLNET